MTTLNTLLKHYPKLDWRARLHMTVRWWICPLQRIGALVPPQGSVIDLGCGHGLFTLLLAHQSSERDVLGIDLDAEKIALAQTLKLPNLRFIAADIAQQTDLPKAQAITITDVFYLIPYDAQERLLRLCVDQLDGGGVLVLKDMAETPRWKVRLNELEETLAVRVLRITATTDAHQFYFRSRAEWIALLETFGLHVETVPLDQGYLHPHIAFVGRKA